MSSGAPAVILLSGGLDSATVLAIARREGYVCHTLAFDYGQRHRHELSAAAKVARALGAATHKAGALDMRIFGGSALTSDIAVPKDRDMGAASRGAGGASGTGAASDIPITYVPARNLVFLSMALAYAETLGARDVFIGVNAIDYSGYPDCRPEFIRAFERTANLATRAGVEDAEAHFRVRTPLMDLSKAAIIRVGVAMGVDYSLTHSCYDPVVRAGEVLACGHCDSCRLRREGFAAAGVSDPTRYAG